MNQTVCPGPTGAVAFLCALTLRDSSVPSRIQPLSRARMPAPADVLDRAGAGTFAAPTGAMAAICVAPTLRRELP